MGLLAGINDMELLEKTGVGRDINRHYYSADEFQTALARPVVNHLLQLIRFRNEHPAVQGDFSLLPAPDARLIIRRSNAEARPELTVDFSASTLEIRYSDNGIEKRLEFDASDPC